MSNPFIEESTAAFRSAAATPLRSAGAEEDYVDYGDGIRPPPAEGGTDPEEEYVDYGDGIRTPPGQGGADPEEEYVDFGDGIRTPVPSANEPSDGPDLADFGSFEAELARPVGLPDPPHVLGSADAVTHFGAGDVPADGPAEGPGAVDAVGDFGSGEGGGAVLGDPAAAFVGPITDPITELGAEPAMDAAPDLVADADPR